MFLLIKHEKKKKYTGKNDFLLKKEKTSKITIPTSIQQ